MVALQLSDDTVHPGDVKQSKVERQRAVLWRVFCQLKTGSWWSMKKALRLGVCTEGYYASTGYKIF